MERHHISSLLLLGALGAGATGCGSKQEDTSAQGETSPIATLSVAASTPPPPITVPPPVPPPPQPTTVKTADKVDPVLEGKIFSGCCAAIREDARKKIGPVKQRMLDAGRTCDDLASKVRRGELTRQSALTSVRGAVGGSMPPACSLTF
jgi:hypothetical protein